MARESTARFSQASWSGPRKKLRARGALQVGAVGAAIAAFVEHEDIEMRTIVERRPGRADNAAQRTHLVKARAARAASSVMPPLVGGGICFDSDQWLVASWSSHCTKIGTGVEGAQTFVHEIVFVRGAELVERLGDLGLLPIVTFFQTLPSGSVTCS